MADNMFNENGMNGHSDDINNNEAVNGIKNDIPIADDDKKEEKTDSENKDEFESESVGADSGTATLGDRGGSQGYFPYGGYGANQPPQYGYPPYGGGTQPMNGAYPQGYAPYGNNGGTYTMNGETGEYRYRPPHHTYGSNCPPPNHTVSNPNEPFSIPPKKETKKIEGRRFSTAAIALLIVGCVLLSFGAGFGGAYAALAISGNGDAGVIGGGDDLVIYKSAMVTDSEGNEITTDLTVPQVEDIVADSVVEITTEFQSSYGPYQFVSEGAGSGVIISENGYVITNNHVITGDSNEVADTVTVRLKNGDEYEAKVIGNDAESDIALLKVEAENLKAAIVGNSDNLVVGESIVAVGNPLGELGGTVTCGIVSATGRTINVDGTEMNLIQIDAAVNPGNSGGGLFNMKGELVGIVNAKSTGEGVEGLGFAIPVNEAINVTEQIKENGYVTGRTYIGVSFINVTDEFTAYRYFGTPTLGIYVYEVVEGYNESSLQSGDRIVAVNGSEITSPDDIKSIVKASDVGDVLKFTIYRKGTLTEVDVTCYEYVPETAVDFNQQ